MIKRSETIAGCLDDVFRVLTRVRSDAASHSAWLSLDLSMAQAKLLMATLHGGGAVTARALADQLGVGPSAVTPLVDKLVELKFLKREPDPDDRRVIRIKPTAKAHALHDKLLAAGRGMWLGLLSDLNDDELEDVRRCFGALAAAAERKERKGAKP